MVLGKPVVKAVYSVLYGDANEAFIICVDNQREVSLAIAGAIPTPMNPDENRKIRCVCWGIHCTDLA